MGSRQDPNQKKMHNYKLVIDPMIHRSGQKIYRFDGVDPAVSEWMFVGYSVLVLVLPLVLSPGAKRLLNI